MIVLDANVIIAFLEATDPMHSAALRVLESSPRDGFVVNVLTMAEALVYPAKLHAHELAMGRLDRTGIAVLSLAADSALPLARLRASYGLRMPDAVVLHTAMTSKADLATFDGKLATAARNAGVRVIAVASD